QQAEDARAAEGSAWLLRLGSQAEDAALAALFDRSGEYAELDRDLERLAESREGAAVQMKELRGLRRHFEQLSGIDYFPGAARRSSAERLERVVRLVRARINHGEPQAQAATIERLDRAHYRGRLWATRRSLWVDRLASAWLIRRHIDPAARFLWLTHPEDCPEDALGFDFDGAPFTHVGERVSFETLLASFGLEGDAALARIGGIVHTLDVGGVAPEAAGFEALLRGLKARIDDDDRLLEEGGRLLDDLYLAFSPTDGA
ncbi:MAG TPA: chromate resistance protein, partial [Thiobacillaceae bacterium]|nr:chromate resistance protein [Thiobacillaceae bacterium]